MSMYICQSTSKYIKVNQSTLTFSMFQCMCLESIRTNLILSTNAPRLIVCTCKYYLQLCSLVTSWDAHLHQAKKMFQKKACSPVKLQVCSVITEICPRPSVFLGIMYQVPPTYLAPFSGSEVNPLCFYKCTVRAALYVNRDY